MSTINMLNCKHAPQSQFYHVGVKLRGKQIWFRSPVPPQLIGLLDETQKIFVVTKYVVRLDLKFKAELGI